MVREESFDWISSQVVHQVSPYAVTETDKYLIVDNVVLGYEFRMPKDFKTAGARNLSFFMEEAGGKKCEIRHYYIRADKQKTIAIEGEKIVIPFKEVKLIFELAEPKMEKTACAEYLKQIKVNSTAE
ncbi:MAG: hypothetical protein Q7K35_01480 [bacterium]|nr:hypothetical protein [bacterium]